MSASFYDLLKYAKTGIATPEMTGYDKMMALSMAGGSKVQTLTGIPPLSFKSDGTTLISWSMKGNGSQSGTPTPDNPVMPEFVGIKTANLVDDSKSSRQTDISGSTGNTSFSPNRTTSDYIEISASTDYYFTGATTYCIFDTGKNRISGANTQSNPNFTINSGINAAYVRFSYFTDNADAVMLTQGSTAPTNYIPYGYKIPITCAGQTVPVYLGQTQTVRRIKKLVLTGEERWETLWGVVYTLLPTSADTTPATNTLLCDRYAAKNNLIQAQGYPSWYGNNSITFRNYQSSLMIRDDTYGTDTTAWKAYLAAQYANGTPVTVWYVLAEPTTGIVNEPLAKIGDYADELHSEDAAVTIPTANGSNTLTVETDLQPSEVSITGRIKPE